MPIHKLKKVESNLNNCVRCDRSGIYLMYSQKTKESMFRFLRPVSFYAVFCPDCDDLVAHKSRSEEGAAKIWNDENPKR